MTKRKKISVIGGGFTGATTAFLASTKRTWGCCIS